MLNTKRLLVGAAAMFMASAAYAQSYKPVEVVRTLPGWQCMALASAYGPQGTNAPPAPVFEGPEPGAAHASMSGAMLVAKVGVLCAIAAVACIAAFSG